LVRLYVYEDLRGVPPGVVTADAALIVPRAVFAAYRDTGSFAVFADLFRYELMARDLGVWIDCDVLSLHPLPTDAPVLFGWQDETAVNNAVLRLPSDSPILADL